MKIRRLKKDYAVTVLDVSILKWALKNREKGELYRDLVKSYNKSNLSIRNKYHRKHKERIKFR